MTPLAQEEQSDRIRAAGGEEPSQDDLATGPQPRCAGGRGHSSISSRTGHGTGYCPALRRSKLRVDLATSAPRASSSISKQILLTCTFAGSSWRRYSPSRNRPIWTEQRHAVFSFLTTRGPRMQGFPQLRWADCARAGNPFYRFANDSDEVAGRAWILFSN